VIAADFLIDDSPRHFDRFTGQGFLFSKPVPAEAAEKLLEARVAA